jgi:hypothetical protein
MMKVPVLFALTGLIAGITATAANAETDEETLAKFEKNLAEAVVTNDTRIIGPMCADDFYAFDSTTGGRGTKADLIAGIQSKEAIVTEMKFPPFFVRIFGSTGFVQGTNEQTTLYKGKVIHGTYVWFDVFEKRGDHWMWIVSESTKVNSRITDKIICDKPYCERSQPGFSVKK